MSRHEAFTENCLGIQNVLHVFSSSCVGFHLPQAAGCNHNLKGIKVFTLWCHLCPQVSWGPSFPSSWLNFEGKRTIFVQMQLLLTSRSTKGAPFWDTVADWQSFLLWKWRHHFKICSRRYQWYHEPGAHRGTKPVGVWAMNQIGHTAPPAHPWAELLFLGTWTCTGSWKVVFRIWQEHCFENTEMLGGYTTYHCTAVQPAQRSAGAVPSSHTDLCSPTEAFQNLNLSPEKSTLL